MEGKVGRPGTDAEGLFAEEEGRAGGYGEIVWPAVEAEMASSLGERVVCYAIWRVLPVPAELEGRCVEVVSPGGWGWGI